MNNVAGLIRDAARSNPAAALGTFQQYDSLEQAVARAREAADRLRAAGLARGDIVAIIGSNCASYLITWMGAQIAGLQTALINPTYPDEFLAGMLDDLRPQAIVWLLRRPGLLADREIIQIDATFAWDGRIVLMQQTGRVSAGTGVGEDCSMDEIAAYIHTSGTTGNPKFCALSHGYFARLGRYFADTMSLSRHDVVINPLPLFHINPIGNGLVGSLTASAGFLSTERFSTADFWPMVKLHGATALILHGAPAGMLKARTTREDARGHKVKIGFFCDPAFLEQFDVPIGIGGYGSTEAGGYCHSWKFRPKDQDLPAEGATHLSGQPRFDMECSLAEDGEILVRGKEACVLFSGYMKGGSIDPHLDGSGWFHTGDRGRFDEYGRLVFIERTSESIRVNGEYVPIDFLEDRLKRARSLGDFALWREDSPARGHEAVIYTTSETADGDELRSLVADLPRYMHPAKLIRIAAIPRDAGVGKVQRRLLSAQPALDVRLLR